MLLLSTATLLPACATHEQGTAQPSTAAPPAASAGLNYDQMLQAAQSYLDAGNPLRGGAVARGAAAKNPNAPDAYVVIGRAAAIGGDLEQAAAGYEKARDRGSRDRRMFAELASVYDVSKHYDQAIGVYRDFLKDHPDDAEMHQELGLSLVLRGRFDAGAKSLRAAHRLAPDNLQVQTDLGYALFKAGDLGAAAKVLADVIAGDAEQHEAMQFLAQVRAAEGKTKEALGLLDRAIATARTYQRPVRMRAQLRLLSGDAEGALADYHLLLRADPEDAGALIGAAGTLITLGELDEATANVGQARALVGDKPQVQFRAAQIAWRRGDTSAVAILARFAESHPDVLEAWRELRAAAKKTGNERLLKRANGRVAQLEKK